MTANATVELMEAAPLGFGRRWPALCNMQDKYVFCTGGTQGDIDLATTERYDIAKDTWRQDLPLMNLPRRSHSSIAFGTTLYVFCGVQSPANARIMGSETFLNQIEKLTDADRDNDMNEWVLIPIDEALMSPRMTPAVAVDTLTG